MCKKLVYLLFTGILLSSAVVQAQSSPYDRVAYWDSNYGTAWAGDGIAVRDALEAVGYRVVDADELKTWMNARISDGKLSVVVMCRDAVPDTVAESMDASCTIRRYLNAGGKVVWYSDIPFYYQTTSGGANTTWGDSGSTNVLGFGGSTATRDTGDTVTITEDGERWGLITPWSSTRPTLPDAWPNLTILAANGAGNASGWVAHYVEGDTFRGFVRIEDHTGGPVDIDNLIAVAEYVEFFTTAIAPVPGEGTSDIVRDAVLSWTPGEYAATHDVYFGTSFDDVEAASRSNSLGVLVSQGQAEASYDPEGLLEFGQTYYWRIDEVNAAPDNTIYKGAVWSFTTEPFAYPVENIVATSNVASDDADSGPENTINGSGLNSDDQHSINAVDMWLTVANAESPYIQYEFDRVYKLHEMLVWNYNVQFETVLGFGCKDVTVEYSVDGVDWTVLADVEFAQGASKNTYAANTTVDLEGVAAQYVRLSINSRWGTVFDNQYGLSEVRFLYIPAHPREPEPADGADEVSVEAALSWRAGREAAEHEVYFSTDEAAVLDGTALADVVDASTYQPDGIEFGNIYYWMVNEVNTAEAISSWAGDVWSFSTQEFTTVEDFESYNDDDNVIYETWIDGWINETGSTVGYWEAPFAETSVVNSGWQSMPLTYDNSVAPYYSEAERDFDSADWTVRGADTLVVSFRGRAATFTEHTDGSILMGAGGADIWGTSDQFRFAYKQLTGNGSITARVDSVAYSNEWAKAGVMIRQNTNATAVNATICMTPGNGVTFQHRATAGADSSNVAEAGFVAPYWVKLTRTDNVFTAQYSADGVTWTDLTDGSDVEVTMTGTVLIGLALTSHDSSIMTNAEFSNVSTTGSVSGSWQVQAIGVEQPGNSAESLYVAIKDASGKVATVTHPDAQATISTVWQQWQIPLSDFAGVNMARVQTMYIGLGDRNNPSAGGTGLIYIDDIGFGTPLSHNVMVDVTGSSDVIQGVPNDGVTTGGADNGWPAAEYPGLAIDNDVNTKFLHFKGETEPTGIQVTPAVGSTIVTELTLTTANDAAERDPVSFELYGSNESIDGPYTLIASGDVVDFAQETAWERFTQNETKISFDNDVAYAHYQILFPAVRDASSANSMQIAEVELIGTMAP